MIKVDSISKSFGQPPKEVAALSGVDLTLQAHDFLCIYGASGSGKTTLVRVCTGLLEPDEGTLTVNDSSVYDLPSGGRADLRLNHIGLVTQGHGLVSFLSAVENVEVPLRCMGMSAEEARPQALEALDSLGIKTLADRSPEEMSGGQRQRVSCARAMVGGRRIIVADEPTGALDRANSTALFGIFSDLASEGYAVMVVTHDPLASKAASRLAYMDDGKLHFDHVPGITP